MCSQWPERTLLTKHRVYHVFPTVVSSPTQFWVHLADGAPQLDQLRDQIEDYQASLEPASLQNLIPGTVCLAKYGDVGEECFYRAVVTESSQDTCKVYFVDYGNSEVCPIHDIRTIPDQFLTLPQQAVSFALDTSTNIDINALTESESVYAKVLKIDESGHHIVNISMNRSSFEREGNSEGKKTFSSLQFNLGKYVDVCISSIDESGFFYCQLIENAWKLDQLMCELQDSYSEISRSANVQQDAVCVALDPIEQICYRAEVLSHVGDRAVVRYVDFGDSVTIPVQNLKKISGQHEVLPVQSVKCSLHETDGAPVSNVISVLQRYSSVGLVAKVVFRTAQSYEMDLVYTGGGREVHLTDILKGVSPNDSEMSKLHDSVMTLPKVQLKPADIQIGTLEKIYVTAVNSSSEFFGQLIKYDSHSLEQMQEKLYQFYTQNTIIHRDPAVEDVCCTLFSGDGMYYRAFIENIDNLNEQALVTFIDYGNEERKNFKELKLLDEQFAILPKQGIHCTLKEFYDDIGNKLELEALLIEKEIIVQTHGKLGHHVMVTIPACPENESVNAKLARFLKKAIGDSHRLSPSPKVPDTDISTANQSSMMQALVEGSWEEVVVSFVEDPGHFYCQQSSQLAELDKLMAHIASYCEMLGPDEGGVDVGLGNACVAQYSEDGKWYRATITGVRTNGEVEVHFIDYGNRELVRQEQLKGVIPAFLTLPSQAYLCTLNGLASQTVWTTEQVDDFYNMADKPLMALVISINTQNECYTVELFDGQTNFNAQFSLKHSVASAQYQPLVIGPNGHPQKPPPVQSAPSKQPVVARAPVTTPVVDRVPQPLSPVAPAASWASWPKEDTPALAKIPVQTINPMPLKVNDYYDVYISYAEHPGQFWIQLVNKEDDLATLMAKLNKTYLECSAQLPLPSAVACVGQPCCAKYSEDNQWYRACITAVNGDVATVRFIDYGNQEGIKVSLLCKMTDMYAAQPMLAAECSLMGLKPVGGEWTSAASEKFEELWYEKNLVACVTSVNAEQQFVVELMEGQTNLSEVLIRSGLACGLEPQTAAPARGLRRSSSSSTSSSSRGDRTQTAQLLYKRVSINIGMTVDAVVSHVNSPKDFYCQPLEFAPKLEEVMGKLTEYDNLRPNQLVLLRPRVGSVCAARYSADDAWYRAEVLEIETERVKVRFVDYGNTEWVKNERIRNMTPDLVDLPTQAVQCELANIDPTSSGWTEAIAECFEDMTIEKTMSVSVKEIQGAKHSIVLTDSNGKDLAKVLVQKGMALGSGNEVEERPRRMPQAVRPPPVPAERVEVPEIRPPTQAPTRTQQHGGYGEPAESRPPNRQPVMAQQNAGFGETTGVVVLEAQRFSPGESFSAYITWVNSPLDFFCQKTDSSTDLANIQPRLESVYGRCPPQKECLNQPKVSQVCAARFSQDGSWYRASISEIVGQNAVVLFVDYGNTDRLPLNKLKILRSEFGKLPIQTVHCCLDGIDDPGCGSWNDRVVQLFQKICQEELCVSIISKKQDVYLISLKDSRGNDVTQQLRKLGVPASPASTPPRPDKPRPNVPRGNAPHPAQTPVPPPSAQVSYKPVNKPVIGKAVNGVISFFENLNNFWVQLSSGTADLDQLMADIETHYTALSPSQDNLTLPFAGKSCIAKYAEDGEWYRATITKTTGNTFQVYFVDYGNSEAVAQADLKTVKPNLASLPMQALHCGLEGCSSAQDDAKAKFEALTGEKELMLKVSGFVGEKAVVQLEVDGKSINSQLGCQESQDAPATNDVATHYKDSKFPDNASQVLMSHIESPDQFYVQLKSQENEIGEYVSEVDEYYHTLSKGNLCLKDAKVGSVCCCQFEEDEAWYRGILEEVSGDQAIVRFIDFGNTQITTISDLKQMTGRFAERPAYAYACRLAGVRALITGWPDESMDKFRSLTEEKTLSAEKVVAGSITAVKLREGKKEINEIMLEYGQSDVQTSPVRTKREQPQASPPRSSPVMSGMSSERYPSVSIPTGTCKVFMSHVDSPGSFYVQLDSEIGKLQNYMDELYVEYSNYGEEMMLSEIAMGQPCCALYSEDQSWYRAIVMGQPRPGQVMVRFIDYGNTENTDLVNVKQLAGENMKKPPYAIRCTLGNKEWPGKDKERLMSLLEDKELEVEFLSQKEPCQVKIAAEGQDIGSMFVSPGSAPPSPQRVAVASPMAYSKRQIPQSEVAVFVSHINSPASFYIQLVDEVEQLEEYSTKLNEKYDGDSPAMSSPLVGQPCCALFSDDNMWYRALVKQVQADAVTVLFVDYGNEETTTLASLKVLTPQFGERPPYAIHCHLAGASTNCSDSDIATFSTKAMDAELMAKITTQTEPCEVHLSGDGLSFSEFCQSAGSEPETTTVKKYCDREIPTDVQHVITSHVDSPASFYLQLVTEEDELVAFSTELTELYYSLNAGEKLLKSVEVGQPCCTLFSEDEAWYRAIVEAVSGDAITVRFVDYGNPETTDISKLRQLDVKFAGKAPYAFHCTINPAVSQWAEDDTTKLEAMIVDKSIEVKFLSKQQPYHVALVVEGTDVSDALTPRTSQQADFELMTQFKPRTAFPGTQDLIVSHIDTPDSFYIQLASEEDELAAFASELNDYYYALDETKLVVACVDAGQPCCALFSEDEAWYRALVETVEGDSVTVRFVDYGNTETTVISKLRQIDVQYGTKPPYALRCSLGDGDRVFTDTDTAKFEEMVVDKSIQGSILSSKEPVKILLVADGVDVNASFGVRIANDSVGDTSPLGICRELLPRSAPQGPVAVCVSHIDSPASFFIQLVEEAEMLESVATQLNDEYTALMDTDRKVDAVQVGDICCALYSEDECWYRATVETKSAEAITVRFVDYGNSEVTDLSKLRTLGDTFGKFPPYSLRCCLDKVKHTCDEKDTEHFTEIVMEKDEIQATFVTQTPPYIVRLKVDGEDINTQFAGEDQETVTETGSLKIEIIETGIKQKGVLSGTQSVTLAHFESPSCFFLHLEDKLSELEEFADEINEIYSELDDSEKALDSVQVGDHCCALYSEDGVWYRAVIEKKNADSAEVRFMDYGNTDTVEVSSLRYLDAKFGSVPPFAHKCHLGSDESREWSQEKCEAFEEMVTDSPMQAVFIGDVESHSVQLITNEKNVMYKLTGESQPNTDQLAIICNGDVNTSEHEETSSADEFNSAQEDLSARGKDGDDTDSEVRQMLEDQRKDGADSALSEISDVDLVNREGNIEDEDGGESIESKMNEQDVEKLSNCVNDVEKCEHVDQSEEDAVPIEKVDELESCAKETVENTDESNSGESDIDSDIDQEIETKENLENDADVIGNDEGKGGDPITNEKSDDVQEGSTVKEAKDEGSSDSESEGEEEECEEQEHEEDKDQDDEDDSAGSGHSGGGNDSGAEASDSPTPDSTDDTGEKGGGPGGADGQSTDGPSSTSKECQESDDVFDTAEDVTDEEAFRDDAECIKDEMEFEQTQKTSVDTCDTLCIPDLDVPLNSKFEVTITHVQSLASFWVTPTASALDRESMEEHLSSCCNEMSPDDEVVLVAGSICAAKSADCEMWLRAKIVTINDDDTVTVFYLDYGNEERIDREALRRLPPDSKSLPGQAILASMEGIEPMQDDWSQASIDALYFENPLLTEVLHYTAGVAYVRLFDMGLDVAKKMVKDGLVRIAGCDSLVDAQQFSSGLKDPCLTEEDTISVYVPHILSPHQFCCQLAESSTNELPLLHDKIQAICADETQSVLNLEDMKPGAVCVAQYQSDENWYRAHIVSISGDDVRVMFVDYGNGDTVERCKVRAADASLLDLPMQTFWCSLHGVSPVSDQWDEESSARFSELVHEKELMCHIKKIHRDHGKLSRIDVELYDGQESIGELLLSGGYALTQDMAESSMPPAQSTPARQSSEHASLADQPTTPMFDTILSVIYCDGESPDKFYCQIQTGASTKEHSQSGEVAEKAGPDVEEESQPAGAAEEVEPTESDARDELKAESTSNVVSSSIPSKEVLCCRLAGIESDTWTSEACQYFRELCHGGHLTARLVGELEEADECINLVYLYNTQDATGNSVNYQLVSHGYAWVTLLSELSISTEDLDNFVLEQGKTEGTFLEATLHHTNSLGSLEGEAGPDDAAAVGECESTYSTMELSVGDKLEAYVLSAIDPDNIICQPIASQSALDEMMEEMNSYYDDGSVRKPFSTCDKGMPCLVKYGVDNRWYRAKVMSKMMVEDVATVEVYYVDHGNKEMVDAACVRLLRPEFMQLPVQAIRISVSDVKPDSVTWDEETQQLLESTLISDDGDLVVTVNIVSVDEDNRVEATLETNTGIDIAQFLLEKNVAIRQDDDSIVEPPMSEEDIEQPSTGTTSDDEEILPMEQPMELTVREYVAQEACCIGHQYETEVSHVVSPSQFWCQLSMETYNELHTLLQDYYSKCTETIDEVSEGDACVARCSSNDTWNRALVISTYGNIASVRLVDIGGTETTTLDQLRPLRQHFAILPPTAVHCSLADCVPLHGYEWSEAASDAFANLCHGRLSMEVVEISSEAVVVNLRCQESEQSISRQLTKLNLAKECRSLDTPADSGTQLASCEELPSHYALPDEISPAQFSSPDEEVPSEYAKPDGGSSELVVEEEALEQPATPEVASQKGTSEGESPAEYAKPDDIAPESTFPECDSPAEYAGPDESSEPSDYPCADPESVPTKSMDQEDLLELAATCEVATEQGTSEGEVLAHYAKPDESVLATEFDAPAEYAGPDERSEPSDLPIPDPVSATSECGCSDEVSSKVGYAIPDEISTEHSYSKTELSVMSDQQADNAVSNEISPVISENLEQESSSTHPCPENLEQESSSTYPCPDESSPIADYASPDPVSVADYPSLEQEYPPECEKSGLEASEEKAEKLAEYAEPDHEHICIDDSGVDVTSCTTPVAENSGNVHGDLSSELAGHQPCIEPLLESGKCALDIGICEDLHRDFGDDSGEHILDDIVACGTKSECLPLQPAQSQPVDPVGGTPRPSPPRELISHKE